MSERASSAIVDPTGELARIYNDTLVKHESAGAAGAQRAAIEAVERAVNGRWLDMLPPGSLMCGCGDIVETEHQCENCDTADWAARGGDESGRSEHRHTSWEDVKASRSDRADNARDGGSSGSGEQQ